MAQNQPMYRYIADDLRTKINSGELAPNDKLPTEGELSEQYEASRNTVREAIRRLTDEGLLESRPGQGTFVARKVDPFVTVLTAARSYNPERGEPGAWLLGITARLIANARRRKGRESAAMARIAGRRLIDQSDIDRLEERMDAARSSQAVLAALDRLRPRAREALLLVSEAGLRPAEAARVLGISPAAFRMRLSSARQRSDGPARNLIWKTNSKASA